MPEKSSSASLDSQTSPREAWLAMEPLSSGTQARIADVAARAGVGVATVSRVLNGRANVRPATRDRVLDAIATLNYQPRSAPGNHPRQRTTGTRAPRPCVH